jgi:hypothetical protein
MEFLNPGVFGNGSDPKQNSPALGLIPGSKSLLSREISARQNPSDSPYCWIVEIVKPKP